MFLSMATQKTTLPSWDLSDLFSHINDPKIEQNLKRSLKRAEAFAKANKGKIKASIKPEALLKMIREYESIVEESGKPEIYAMLVFSADSQNPKHGAFYQKTKQEGLKIYQAMLFFELELSQLPEASLNRLTHHKTLLPYRHYLKRIADYRPHRLDEAREQLMNDLELTGGSAFARMFDEELSNKKFKIQRGKQVVEVSEEEALHGLHQPDRAERIRCAESVTNGLQEESRRLTYITNILLQRKATVDRYVKFSTPEASRHLSNETTQKIVDAMTQTITERYDLVKSYYQFKKKLLKLDKLYDYDRYAPLAESKSFISWNEAQGIVLSAYRQFSPEFADIAQKFFDNNWIDAAIRPGKRGGAFCMFVTTDLHPYVFVNYKGGVKDVLTLAHELGHAVHAYLAREQSYLNFDMPLTFAETASVFAEMVVFDYLRERMKDPKEKLALYLQKIEEVFATIFRQTAMYRFEQTLHAASRAKGELSTEEINALWLKSQQEMFGNSVTLTKNYGIWWSYISHFIHTPFYVYAYAFGEILTLSLFAQYKKDGETLVKKYFDLLRAGGSKTPEEFLRPFGLRLDDANFWKGGIKLIEQLVNEAQQLNKKY